MAFNLRKVLAAVLVTLMIVNALPVGLPQGAGFSGAVRAETLEEASSDDQAGQSDAGDASGDSAGYRDSGSGEGDSQAPDAPQVEPSSAPGAEGAAPSEQPDAEPDAEPSEQPDAEPDGQQDEQPDAEPSDDAGVRLVAKAANVVSGVKIIADGDDEEEALLTAIIPLNTGASRTLDLEAVLSYAVDGASSGVKWTTSSSKIAKVSADGLSCTVTGRKAGTAKITATATDGSKKKATCKVTVATLVETIAVTPATANVVAGFTLTLKASISPSKATNKAVSWTSSDPAVATVSSKGVVKGVAPGEAVITATAKDGSLVTGTKAVTVLPATTGIQLTADGEQASSGVIDMASEKKTILLQAQVSPAGATQAVTWTTSSAKIAKVSADGLSCTVTGVKEGSATITAKAKDGTGKKATFSVSVKQLVKTVEITGASALTGGKSATLKVLVTPSKATSKAVSWTSSDESLAKVTSKGVVTAAAVTQPETVTITATAKDGSGIFDTHDIQITPAAAQVAVVSTSGSSLINLSETDPADRTLQLTAAISPEDAAQGVTWSSSDTKIAKVSSGGLVTGVKPGSAKITAKASDGSGVKGTFAVTVTRLAQSVTITGASALIGGKSVTLKAAVAPSNTTNNSVSWASSDESLATVTSKGVVTAAAVAHPETVTITATAKDGSGAHDTHDILITPAAAQVTVTSTNGSSLIDLGEKDPADRTLQLTAAISPEDAAQDVTWSSSDTKIAKVSSGGLVTGVKPGSVTITAKASDGSGVKGPFAVTVTRLVQSVTVTGNSLLVEGRSTTLKATVAPSNATNNSVNWTSGDEGVATVTSKGVVTAKAVSARTNVTITATAKDASGFSGTLVITVVPAVDALAIQLDGEDVDAVPINLNDADRTAQLTALVSPADAIEGATWKSSDSNIAKVSSDGLVTGLKKGSVTITATAVDGSGVNKKCTVSVAYRATGIEVTGPEELAAGESATLQATVTPSSAPNKTVLWSVDDEDAASITSAGLLTALDVDAATEVTVTATAADGSEAYGTWLVTILPRPASVSIQADGEDLDSATIYLTDTPPALQLTASVEPEDARQAVTWSSSNSAVATVSAAGLVTAHAAGSAVITATAAGTSVAGTLALTVEDHAPALTMHAITPASRLVEVGQEITWTLDARGDGDIGYDVTVLKDGEDTDAEPDVTGSTVTFTPDESGTYQLRVIASNQFDNEDTMTGGDATACELSLSIEADSIALGGQVTSGSFGSFGPDVALPSGTRIEYALARTAGSSLALSISGTAGSICSITYAESELGESSFRLTYTAWDGVSSLFTGYDDFDCEVVMEEDLPAGVQADPGEYVGEAGTAISIPLTDLTLDGGALLPGDFDWSLEDEDGPVGDGLAFQTDEPGRYELTLTGVYGTCTLSCPVVITVNRTIQLSNDIRLDKVYPDTDQTQYIGHVWVTGGGELGEGEEYTWTLERTGGDSVDLVIEDNGPGVDYAKLIMTAFGAVESDAENDFTLTCEVNEYFRGEAHFSITNCVEGLTGLPTGITCTPDHYEIEVGGSVTFDASNVEGVGTTLPDGSWYDAYDVPWDVCEPTFLEDGFQVTFNQPGRYLIQAAAGYQSYRWVSSDILVTVGDGVSPDFGLDVYQRTEVLYQDAGEEGFLADIKTHDALLLDGEKAQWTLTTESDPDSLPAVLSLVDKSDDHVTVLFSDLESEGEVTYTLTYDAGIYHAQEDITVEVVANTPDGLPTGVSYPETTLYLDPGDTYDFDRALVEFTGGTQEPDGAWYDLWIPDELQDATIWDEDACTVTFEEAGRYIVTAAAGFANYEFTYPVEIVVGEASQALKLATDQYYDKLYSGAQDNVAVARISLKNFDLKDGETCDWSVERTDGTGGDPVSLTLWSDDEKNATVDFHLGEGTGTASFRVTAQVGAYSATADIDLEVIAYDPAELPSGVASPYQTSYQLSVGDALTFDPEELDFASGTVPDGLTAWKLIDLNDGDWDQVDQESAGGEAVRYAFNAPGRYILTLVVGIYNHICWQDVSIVVTDESGVMDPGIGYDQRFETLYLNGVEEDRLGDAHVDRAVVRPDSGETAEWSIIQTGDEGVAEVSIDPEGNDTGWARILFKMLGETGTVHYQIRYQGLDGLYDGVSEAYTLNVEPALEGLPEEVLVPQDHYELTPGEGITLYYDDIGYDEINYSIPEGADVAREYWTSGGDWDQVDQDWIDEGVGLTFNQAGYYGIDAALCIGNVILSHRISVLVGDEIPMDAGLSLSQRFTTAYLDGSEEEYLGSIKAENVQAPEGEEKNCSWTVTPLTEGASDIAEIFLIDDYSDVYGTALFVRLGSQAGTVSYRLDYAGLDGLYVGSQEVSLTVEEDLPEGLPTAIGYEDAEITLEPGESVVFETAKITQEGGAVPEGTESWETFWFAEGNFDAVTSEWNEDQDEFTATFPDEGLYTVQAALGVGNYVLTADISVRVLTGESLDAGLAFSPRYETVWTGGVAEEYIGSVDARNMTVGGDGYDYTWAIEPISGGEVADVFFNEDAEDIHGVPVHYQLKSGAGTVRYLVTYSAMNGLIQGSCEVEFEVVEGDIEGLPAGIGYEPSSAQLEPGDSFTFNMDQITVDGSVPEGHTVWKDVWTDGSNWDGVGEEWNEDGTLRTRTFDSPGRYLAQVVLGVDNFVFTAPVTITVLEEGQEHLDPGFSKYQHGETAYLNGNDHDWLCDIYADGANLSEEERQAADWDCTQTLGEDVATASFEEMEWDSNGRHMEYDLKGITGDAQWEITYSAADGLYQGTIYVNLKVEDALTGLPSGITYDGDTAFEVAPGGEVSLDLTKLAFTEDGTIPGGVEPWQDIWNNDGDWDGVEENWNEGNTIRTNVFPNEGRYLIDLAMGVGNYTYTLPVTVTVLSEGQEYLDPGFSKYQHGETAYLNGNDHDWLCDIYADGARLTEAEREAAEWTCEQIQGATVATASFEAMDWDSNGRHMEYDLTGITGHARWLITYSAADGLYQGTLYVDLEVEDALTGLPSGITYDGDTAFEVAPGGEVSLDLTKLAFTEDGTIPGGVEPWQEIWNDDGDWDGVEENWNEGNTIRTNVFPNEGRYLINLAMGVGNYTYTLPVTVAVLGEGTEALDPGLRAYQRSDTVYLDGQTEGLVCDIYAEGARLTEEERQAAVWTCDQVQGEAVATASFEVMDWDSNGRRMEYDLTGITGDARWEITYSAADGLYQGTIYVNLEVEEALTGLPSGITYDGDTAFEVAPGGEVSLDLTKLAFTEDGTIPGGVEPWQEIWNNDGDWDGVEENWNEEGTIRTNVFPNEGRYLIDLAMGVGNYTYTLPVTIAVLGEGQEYLDPGLHNENQRSGTVYLNGNDHDWLCDIYAESARLTEEERQAAVWTCDQVQGEAVATASFEATDWDSNGRHMEYDLKGIAGHARWLITYSAADGLYQGTLYVDLEVEEALTGLPSGITYDGETAFEVAPGGEVSLDLTKLAFTEDGTIPSGVEPWKEIRNNDGDWDGVEENWNEEGTIRTNVFPNEGRYLIDLAMGVGNYTYTLPVTVAVLGEGTEALDPGLYKNQRSETIYLNGNDHDWLCDIYAGSARLTEEERQAADWDCIQTLGATVATASFEVMDWDSNGRHMEYDLTGIAGHAQWEITYSAADGLYQGTLYVDLEVEDALTGLPSGITYDGDTAFEVAPGGEVSLDLTKLAFTEDGTIPGGVEPWQEIWNDDGDWDGVEENWNEEGTIRTTTFSNEGRYILKLAMGVGNYTYTLPVTVTVRSDENTPLDPDLQVKIRSTVLYDGGPQDSYLGDANVNAARLTEAEKEGVQWTLTPVSGSEYATVYFENEDDPYSRRLCYRLGTGLGSVEYLLTYSAADGAYADSESIVLDVQETPESMPEEISYPETSFIRYVGESVSLNLDDIQFIDWEEPQDAPTWRQMWNDSGDWGSVEESWDETNRVRTNTFQSEGIYTVYLAAGVGNYQYLMLVTITVLPE